MRRSWQVVVVAIAVVGGAGCAAGTPEPPAAIECTVQVRPVAGAADGEVTTTVRVDRQDGGVGTAGEEVVVEPFRFRVEYVGEAPEGRFVSVDVTGAGGARLTRDLFQYAGTDALRTELAGAQGFTGLRYVYDGDAELQYLCGAVG